MIYDFDQWRARFVIQALEVLEEKWEAIVRSTEDEDVQADYGMDLAKLGILKEGFERQAVQEFGPRVKNSTSETIANMTSESVGLIYGECLEDEAQPR